MLEYQGTRYAGFQIQRGLPTVQGALQEALLRLTGERIRTTCASRTDAGAHAKGQVVSFATQFPHPAERVASGLNHFLPEDIRVVAAQEVPWGFDARRSARSREYRYVVLHREAPSALLRHLAYHLTVSVDREKMQAAASLLVGKHDFAAFAGPLEGRRKSAVRTVERLQVWQEGHLLFFTVEGDAFLPQQVRRMVGSVLEAGQGNMSPEELRQRVESGPPGSAGPCLPAHGLYLMKVRYREFSFPPAE